MDVGLTLTAFGAMMAGFFAISRLMLNQSSKDREDDRAERREGINASRNMAKAFTRVAEATEKAGSEAKMRNGHLGALVNQGNIMTAKIVDRLEKSAVTLTKDTK